MEKKIVFVDMDGVLADFDGSVKGRDADGDAANMAEKYFFSELKVMDCAQSAILTLLKQEHLDIYIGSKPTTKDKTCNFYCPSEKYQWINRNFPALIKKMNLVCDKALLRGDYLIDDDAARWEGRFQGEFLHFDKLNPMASWIIIFGKLKIKLC